MSVSNGANWIEALKYRDSVFIMAGDGQIHSIGNVSLIGGAREIAVITLPERTGKYVQSRFRFSKKTGKEIGGVRWLQPYDSNVAAAWKQDLEAQRLTREIANAEAHDRRVAALLAKIEQVDWQIVLEDFGDTALNLLEGIIPSYVATSKRGQKELEEWHEAARQRFSDPALAPYRIKALNGDPNRETLQWLVEEASEEDIIAWINEELE